MGTLLNTLYVTTPDAYLRLDGGTVVVEVERESASRFHFTTWERAPKRSSAIFHPPPLGNSTLVSGRPRKRAAPVTWRSPWDFTIPQ